MRNPQVTFFIYMKIVNFFCWQAIYILQRNLALDRRKAQKNKDKLADTKPHYKQFGPLWLQLSQAEVGFGIFTGTKRFRKNCGWQKYKHY